ncbi:MAG: riboflavin synthase [Thalassospira sp.]|jgi:riboflavin synthase|uniref:riboflavin synthase n=1 Tax=Thalassospira TaxID=168934 RepID=UPI0007A56919|nr:MULTISPECIES: riboflavin synthase [unclassified Thalassospira]MBE71983.1 riboflavin synthase [Thalassospira sp.]BDW88899.1 riboflavin synthase subunit alpha [Thalassospira tepidiphila]KZC97804.1 riboflavin synthase subunit alpha [Thalassospira sp. MCCC 1A02898]ONH88030.1 riboflavin synthase subunit alpha [Thalassospira sp. MCCC 1A02803]BDW95980.1 riboflavin synthase subunit alpha [Thalassospira tepidiphila]|tara:strand:- start:110 stop:697 length:588 start_codon:yes stop_codon:yes gene_type:complete
MFTGIITDIATVRAIKKTGDTRFEFTTSFDTSKIVLGASIACNGACMTVIETGDDWFAIEASAESLSRTTLGDLVVGSKVNLEQATRVGDELGGHIVSGHVDGVATLTKRVPEGDSLRLTFEVPEAFAKYIASKGSVTLEGVSLTVNEVDGNTFGINLIPHTQNETTLGSKQPGDRINFEIDMLARYVARMLGKD